MFEVSSVNGVKYNGFSNGAGCNLLFPEYRYLPAPENFSVLVFMVEVIQGMVFLVLHGHVTVHHNRFLDNKTN
jgi:hypothetical protein